jgi:lipoprotein-releasing system permease protein
VGKIFGDKGTKEFCFLRTQVLPNTKKTAIFAPKFYATFFIFIFSVSTEFFIARRLIFSGNEEARLLRPIMRISVASVAISLAVMLVAMAVLTGFKQQITHKVTGFLAHVQITNFEGNNTYETSNPISSRLALVPQVAALPEVEHVQTFALKPGIISASSDIQGVVLKGIDANFDWSFFAQNMVSGAAFTVSDSGRTNDVALSQALANLLQLRLGDSFDMLFVQEPPRMRRFHIAAMFDTKFTEFDKRFVLCDIGHVQRLNGWRNDHVSGLEIYVKNFDHVDDAFARIEELAGYKLQPDGTRLYVESVKTSYAQIFDWLALQDLNAWIILALMLVVAGFNMVSSLLIMLLQRSQLIGVLKALGMGNGSLQKIFIYQSAFVALRGLLLGNLLGLGLCFAQLQWGFIPLNPDTYYLTQVPIDLRLWHVLALNVGAMTAIVAMLALPSMLVARIMPSKTLRFS